MNWLFAALLLMLVAASASAVDVTDTIDCAVINDDAIISIAGANSVLFTISGSLGGGCIITPEVNDGVSLTWFPVTIRRDSATELDGAPQLTSGNTALFKAWVYQNTGWASFRLRVSTFGSPGFVTFNMSTSASATAPGMTPITTRHPGGFSCTLSSTAVVLTEITSTANCGGIPLAVGQRYITSIQWSSSIISSTTNFMLFRSGAPGTCGSPVDRWRGMSPAFETVLVDLKGQPVNIGVGQSLCFIHAGAGTRFVNVQGYTAP